MKTINHWIDGQLLAGTSGRTGDVFDPAKGKVQAQVDFANTEELDAAIAVSVRASKVWRETSLAKRTAVMFRFRELLELHKQELAEIITGEHGKTVPDALGELQRGIECVEYACGISHHLKGGYSEQVSTNIDTYSIMQPLGVAVGITPFNFPVMVPLWMLSNAIACGNAFILKPSEKDPSAAIRLAELLSEAGLPAGVFNVIHGDRVAVNHLLSHEDIAAISFVGSTPIARHVYEQATVAGKRVQALGGAKNHMVVLPDADVDAAANAAISAGYGSAGERCMAISVVVAVGDVADRLVEAIAKKIPDLRIGAGNDSTTDIGPLITGEHRDKVASYVDAASKDGAAVVVDGRSAEYPSEGFFLGPTLVDHVEKKMSVYTDEIFGPVLSVVRVETYDEALALVNSNEYGNGVALFTRDGGAARKFQFECTVGMVGINISIPVPVAFYSFGGWKSSLFGDTHMYGPDGVRFFTRTKVVTSSWPDPMTSKIDLGFPKNG